MPEGTIDPSAASGASALRPSIGTRAAVFSGSGGTAQPARCRVRLGALTAGAWSPSQRPHRRGMGSPGSILGGDNCVDFHGGGVGVPFQRLNCEERL